MTFKLEQEVRIANPTTEPNGNLITAETIEALKACNFTGKVTQIKDDLIYVGFISADTWVTQVFKAEELEVVA